MTYSNNTPPHIKAGIPAPKDLPPQRPMGTAAAVYPAMPTLSRAQRSLMAMLWIWVCRMNRAFETRRAAGHRKPTATFKFTLFMIGLILRVLPGTAAEKQALFQHMASRHRQDRRVKRQRVHKICLRQQARRLWTLMLPAARVIHTPLRGIRAAGAHPGHDKGPKQGQDGWSFDALIPD